MSRLPLLITAAQVEELHDAGYSDREIAEVVGVVALNVLTGAFYPGRGPATGPQLNRCDGAELAG